MSIKFFILVPEIFIIFFITVNLRPFFEFFVLFVPIIFSHRVG